MHTALNKTLAKLPDDTKIYVSLAARGCCAARGADIRTAGP